MPIGCFTEQRRQPTDDEIRTAIDARLTLWEALLAHIRANYACSEDLHYMYGKTYGWALRFRAKGRLLTNLYPTEGGFTVQINLSPEGVEQARTAASGAGVSAAIERARPYPEGRWLFIPVADVDDLADVEVLLALRAAEKRISGSALA